MVDGQRIGLLEVMMARTWFKRLVRALNPVLSTWTVSYGHKMESQIQDNSLDFQQVAAELHAYANTHLSILTPRVAKGSFLVYGEDNTKPASYKAEDNQEEDFEQEESITDKGKGKKQKRVLQRRKRAKTAETPGRTVCKAA